MVDFDCKYVVFEEVQAVTKAGTGCTTCVDSVKALVDKLLAK
jgi:NAD(P)H-nitrite reductase large subunit